MAAKKAAVRKANAAAAGKTPPKLTFFDKNDVPDRISRFLDATQLVPPQLRGSDRYLDIVSWNIRWFDSQDPRRIEAIRQVLGAINADILVLTEIQNDGALDAVAAGLAEDRVGFYSTHYGESGEQQRVALMWDRDWVRSKMKPRELFADAPTVTAENGRKAEIFPRRPLWGYFEAKSDKLGKPGFTFELAGVHLKSQMPPKDVKGFKGRGGIAQRTEAAKRLAAWLDAPGEHYDEDVLIVGDWNAVPDAEEWQPFDSLEKAGKVDFKSINKGGDAKSDVTHIARFNKSGFGGSRLDIQVITNSEEAQNAAVEKAAVIRWSFESQLEALSSDDRNLLFKAMKMNFSDHLPVVSRFYFTAVGKRR